MFESCTPDNCNNQQVSVQLNILARPMPQGPRVHNARYDLEFFVEQTVELLENIGHSLTSSRCGVLCSCVNEMRLGICSGEPAGIQPRRPWLSALTSCCCSDNGGAIAMAFARCHPARAPFQGLLSCFHASADRCLCKRLLALLPFPRRGLYREYRDCTTSCVHDAQLKSSENASSVLGAPWWPRHAGVV